MFSSEIVLLQSLCIEIYMGKVVSTVNLFDPVTSYRNAYISETVNKRERMTRTFGL